MENASRVDSASSEDVMASYKKQELMDDRDAIVKVKQKRQSSRTKDRNGELFWEEMDDVLKVCQLKSINAKWGPKRILEAMMPTHVTEQKVKRYVCQFFFDTTTGKLYYRNQDFALPPRECVSRERLVELMKHCHAIDHRHGQAIYESLRMLYYPCVRESMAPLFKNMVLPKCKQCRRPTPINKLINFRKRIPATYPNSRWQVKLLPVQPFGRYQYLCSIVDCYSYFAFGAPLETKSPYEISKLFSHFMYLFGPPRIIHTDNKPDFTIEELAASVRLLDTSTFGRPILYPQYQGKVETFHHSVAKYLQEQLHKINWVDQLSAVYYTYNNQVRVQTHPLTPSQKYFNRIYDQSDESSDFLKPEERDFLSLCHLDVMPVSPTNLDCDDSDFDDENDFVNGEFSYKPRSFNSYDNGLNNHLKLDDFLPDSDDTSHSSNDVMDLTLPSSKMYNSHPSVEQEEDFQPIKSRHPRKLTRPRKVVEGHYCH